MSEAETKALATDNDTQGGYLVPAPMQGRLIEKLIEFSPVRAEVSVVTISAGNAWEAPAEGATDFTAGKVGERDARPETEAGTLRMERIPVHEFYANPFVTQTMLDDEAFGVEAWISQRVSTRRAVLEGGYHINGTAEGEPEGLLTNADITGVNSGATATLTPDGLITLIFDLPAPYARNAVFLWHRSTTAAVRKLKDSQNQYLWAPGLNGATQGTVLGHRYVECLDMPEVEADAEAVIFGDLRAAYKIVDRKGISLMRDPFSSKPFIEMYFTWRTGGQVVLAEAVRKLTVAS
jgi:HK97 family phage major capsid protein